MYTRTRETGAEALVTYIEQVRRALDDEMAQDPKVLVIGEDVAVGGAFGTTKGLVERHGRQRVRNAPISEAAIVGMAVGAAMGGLHPVAEVMFIDFITLAMDGVVNHAAKLHFMSGGQLTVPLVLRTQAGVIGGAAAQHSQSLESWFTHIPGLRVVVPSSAADVYGLLRASIRDPNPVLFIEQKAHYRLRTEAVEDIPDSLDGGIASVVRAGSDATIVTYGVGTQLSLAAAEKLEEQGVSVEVVVLKTLTPLDTDTILTSALKTRRMVVVHEAVSVSGFGAEIAAELQEDTFGRLLAPIVRVGAAFSPIPFSPLAESQLIPTVEDVVAAVGDSVRYTKS